MSKDGKPAGIGLPKVEILKAAGKLVPGSTENFENTFTTKAINYSILAGSAVVGIGATILGGPIIVGVAGAITLAGISIGFVKGVVSARKLRKLDHVNDLLVRNRNYLDEQADIFKARSELKGILQDKLLTPVPSKKVFKVSDVGNSETPETTVSSVIQQLSNRIHSERNKDDTIDYKDINDLRLRVQEQRAQIMALKAVIEDPMYDTILPHQKIALFEQVKSKYLSSIEPEEPRSFLARTYKQLKSISKDIFRVVSTDSEFNNPGNIKIELTKKEEAIKALTAKVDDKSPVQKVAAKGVDNVADVTSNIVGGMLGSTVGGVAGKVIGVVGNAVVNDPKGFVAKVTGAVGRAFGAVRKVFGAKPKETEDKSHTPVEASTTQNKTDSKSISSLDKVSVKQLKQIKKQLDRKRILYKSVRVKRHTPRSSHSLGK